MIGGTLNLRYGLLGNKIVYFMFLKEIFRLDRYDWCVYGRADLTTSSYYQFQAGKSQPEESFKRFEKSNALPNHHDGNYLTQFVL